MEKISTNQGEVVKAEWVTETSSGLLCPTAKTLKQMLQNCSSFLCLIEKHYRKSQNILNRNSSK